MTKNKPNIPRISLDSILRLRVEPQRSLLESLQKVWLFAVEETKAIKNKDDVSAEDVLPILIDDVLPKVVNMKSYEDINLNHIQFLVYLSEFLFDKAHELTNDVEASDGFRYHDAGNVVVALLGMCTEHKAKQLRQICDDYQQHLQIIQASLEAQNAVGELQRSLNNPDSLQAIEDCDAALQKNQSILNTLTDEKSKFFLTRLVHFFRKIVLSLGLIKPNEKDQFFGATRAFYPQKPSADPKDDTTALSSVPGVERKIEQ